MPNAELVTAATFRGPVLAIAYLTFFFSGGAALVYEISWSRQMGLLFGHSAQAAGIVLASYFTGMAIGYMAGARCAMRPTPLLVYAVAELAAGGWACVIPTLLHLSASPMSADWLNNSSLILQTTARAVFCFSLLLPATIALGATLPMMAKFLSSQRWGETESRAADRIALAYAINTAGALFGVFATFFILPIVGVATSSYVAGLLSVVSGLLACALALTDRRKNAATPSGDDSATESSKPLEGQLHESLFDVTDLAVVRRHHKNQRKWFAVAAISGFGTIGLEVLYIRLFSLTFHNSTYTFGAVVAVFLAALAVGAAITARLESVCRTNSHAGRAACLGALSTMFSLFVFAQLTGLDYFSFGNSFADYLTGVFMLVGLVVGPPVTFLGMLLPLSWKGSRAEGNAAKCVGRLTAANAACSAFGAAATSFVILPGLGLWLSFALIGACFFAMSFGMLWWNGQRRLAVIGALCFAMLVVFAVNRPLESRTFRTAASERVRRRWQSSYGVIDVTENRETGSFKVRQNLHYRFGETRTAARESRQSHIPLLLHPRPRDVFVMGLGTGLTAGGAILHEDVESMVVVELIPEVVEAARLLADYNSGVVDHSKVEIRIDDARHSLLTSDRRFDVIISDLFVPWESETGYLYTVEHYQSARQRLKDGGLFCQWIPLYQLGEREFELIADSFASAFPMTTVWWGNIDPAQPIIAVVGSESSVEVDVRQLSARLLDLEKASNTQDEYLSTYRMFHTLYLGDWISRKTNYLNTDEHPRLEFLAPVSHRDRRLLHGLALRDYFDKTFVLLPSRTAHFHYPSGQTPATPAQRRAGQRFVLFGE